MSKSGLLVTIVVGALGCRPAPEPSSPPVTPSDPRAEPSESTAASRSDAPAPEPTTAPAPVSTRTEPLEELVMDVPESWVRQKPKNAMRRAEFLLSGDDGELELVVYRFPGGAGSREANLQRWRGMIEGSDASPPATTTTLGTLTLTVIDLFGAYVTALSPGAPDQRHDDYRMLGAVLEGSGDPFYFKCVGPAALVDPRAADIEAAFRSLRLAAQPM